MENEKKSARALAIRIIKIILFSVMVCFVMSAILSVYLDAVPEKIAELTEKGKMENTIWLVKYASYLSPIIIISVILTVCYKFGYVKVESQRDKAVILAVLLIFIYAVMLPDAITKSEGWLDPPLEGEEETVSVLEQSIGWFAAQIIPFAIAIGYHLVKASSEKKELCDNEE
ncbi:MAG: hypothetical protein IKJ24_05585 [Clostridia bacterium]|nr:hypothetical protein [Clostridia bacterium]